MDVVFGRSSFPFWVSLWDAAPHRRRLPFVHFPSLPKDEKETGHCRESHKRLGNFLGGTILESFSALGKISSVRPHSIRYLNREKIWSMPTLVDVRKRGNEVRTEKTLKKFGICMKSFTYEMKQAQVASWYRITILIFFDLFWIMSTNLLQHCFSKDRPSCLSSLALCSAHEGCSID